MDVEKFEIQFIDSEFRQQFARRFNDELYALNLMNFKMAADLIAFKLKLTIALDMYRRLNPSANLPYHNEYHTECMIANVFEGAIFEGLPLAKIRPLALGANCHDAFHTGGEHPDSENIIRAMDFLAAVINMCKYTDDEITVDEINAAEDYISITEYPYVSEPISIGEKIIRDADLMQAYEADPILLAKQYKGLKDEIEVQKKRTFTAEEFAEGNRQFLDGVVWHTEWAKQKAIKLDWTKHKDRLIRIIKTL
jgi:hypothetical protein